MSVECKLCGKKPVYGNTVSHSHHKTRRRWEPNLQWLKIGTSKRIKACAKCIKTQTKVK